MIHGKIRNMIDMKDVEESIRSYVEKCFKGAFRSEGKEYNKDKWSFEFILIKDKKNKWHMIPFINCEYGRVRGRVYYRLQRNTEKNFGIIFNDDPDMRLLIDDSGTIDPNYTEMMFRVNGNLVSLAIFDNECNNRPKPEGKIIGAYRYDKLFMTYHNINADQFDPELHTDPDDMHDWNKFQKLYEKAFGIPLGKGYETFCSSGIERL